jgi:hypothetical protein
MPNAIPPMVEQRILALALAYPGWGPDRLSLELGREKWGGLKVSANGVWRVLKRHGLNTRAKRLSPGLRLRGTAPAGATRAAARASHRGQAPWSPSSIRQLLHRPPGRHRGRGLAVQRLRRGLLLHLGRAPRQPQESLCPLDLGPGPASRPGALRARLAAGGGDDRLR